MPTSPLYTTKLLEDVVNDNEETCYVKMTWYTQDFVDALLFNNTGARGDCNPKRGNQANRQQH